MTVSELITELQKLDQDLRVCGQSETSTWEMEPADLQPEDGTLILGYKH